MLVKKSNENCSFTKCSPLNVYNSQIKTIYSLLVIAIVIVIATTNTIITIGIITSLKGFNQAQTDPKQINQLDKASQGS